MLYFLKLISVAILLNVIWEVGTHPAYSPGMYRPPVEKTNLQWFNEVRKAAHDRSEREHHTILPWIEIK